MEAKKPRKVVLQLYMMVLQIRCAIKCFYYALGKVNAGRKCSCMLHSHRILDNGDEIAAGTGVTAALAPI
jgi:hypothetical protein